MPARSRQAFLALVVAQALHSAEELATRLYDVLPPASAVAGLLSDDPATGFLVANAALVSFGAWCYLARVRAGRGEALAWGWAAVELANGGGHLALAALRGGYFPGAATAPLLVGVSVCLLRALARARGERAAG
jgi:hypothetical protein